MVDSFIDFWWCPGLLLRPYVLEPERSVERGRKRPKKKVKAGRTVGRHAGVASQ
jgi:hypothetical protein